jgi:hypothetical protein
VLYQGIRDPNIVSEEAQSPALYVAQFTAGSYFYALMSAPVTRLSV